MEFIKIKTSAPKRTLLGENKQNKTKQRNKKPSEGLEKIFANQKSDKGFCMQKTNKDQSSIIRKKALQVNGQKIGINASPMKIHT